jgi:hypothetical protein
VADFGPPIDKGYYGASLGVRYWKAAWQTTVVGSQIALWGNELRDVLRDYLVIIDKIVVVTNTAAPVTYTLVFYQGVAGTGAMAGPQHTTTLLEEYTPFDGPYGPLFIDAAGDALAFGLYDLQTTFTGGDAFTVYLSGRALPVDRISQPQDVNIRQLFGRPK